MVAVGRPEDRARADIDRLLTAAGWLIQNRDGINIEAGRGIAIREFQLAPGYGFADYLLYADGKVLGVIEAKPEGHNLTGVETQSGKYLDGLPSLREAYGDPVLIQQIRQFETWDSTEGPPAVHTRSASAPGPHGPVRLENWRTCR